MIDNVAATHVLVARVRENDNRERCKDLDRSFYVDNINVATRWRSVASSEMVNHKNDKVANGNKRDNGGVLQTVEPAQEGKGYHDEPARMSVESSNATTHYFTYMNAVTQKCLSTRYVAFPGCPKPCTTPGMRSPIMIK